MSERMLKILIADDERIIREGLAEAINYEKLGLSLVGTARDGEEALLLAEATRPDICLVDIMMPTMNGLDFINRMRGIQKDIQFIIITGYDEFEYAQRAIKLEVFDYLLKPIDEEELEKVLYNAIEKIRNQKTVVCRIHMIEDQLGKTFPETLKSFVVNCLNGKSSRVEVEKFEKIYDFHFGEEIGVALLRFSDCVYLGEERSRPDMGELIKELKRCIVQEFSGRGRLLLLSQSDVEGGIVIVAEAEDFGKICNGIQNRIREELEYRAPVFVEVVTEGIDTIDHALSSILHSINRGDEFMPIVRMVKKHIDDHFANPELSLSRIAEEYHISTGHISRLFKRELGISFSDYLEKKRIGKAISLLDEDQKKIYEIAETVGYSSQHYFCATFKKVMGISPSEYKRRHS